MTSTARRRRRQAQASAPSFQITSCHMVNSGAGARLTVGHSEEQQLISPLRAEPPISALPVAAAQQVDEGLAASGGLLASHVPAAVGLVPVTAAQSAVGPVPTSASAAMAVTPVMASAAMATTPVGLGRVLTSPPVTTGTPAHLSPAIGGLAAAHLSAAAGFGALTPAQSRAAVSGIGDAHVPDSHVPDVEMTSVHVSPVHLTPVDLLRRLADFRKSRHKRAFSAEITTSSSSSSNLSSLNGAMMHLMDPSQRSSDLSVYDGSDHDAILRRRDELASCKFPDGFFTRKMSAAAATHAVNSETDEKLLEPTTFFSDESVVAAAEVGADVEVAGSEHVHDDDVKMSKARCSLQSVASGVLSDQL